MKLIALILSFLVLEMVMGYPLSDSSDFPRSLEKKLARSESNKPTRESLLENKFKDEDNDDDSWDDEGNELNYAGKSKYHQKEGRDWLPEDEAKYYDYYDYCDEDGECCMSYDIDADGYCPGPDPDPEYCDDNDNCCEYDVVDEEGYCPEPEPKPDYCDEDGNCCEYDDVDEQGYCSEECCDDYGNCCDDYEYDDDWLRKDEDFENFDDRVVDDGSDGDENEIILN